MDTSAVNESSPSRARRRGAQLALVVLIAALVAAAPGCGNDPTELRSNEWNEMEWDEGAWGLLGNDPGNRVA